MLKIKRFIFNPTAVNTYVVSKGQDGVIIDCGCADGSEWNELNTYITTNNLVINHLLNTHFHLDHVFGNQFALKYMNLKPEANADDYPLYHNLRSQVEMFFGPIIASSLNYDFTKYVGNSLNDGDKISIGDEYLEIIKTPGHTPGGICFYNRNNDILFSGDTLFQGSIGRTDLEGGNYIELIRSITDRLLKLPPLTKVYPGHGDPTTIENEKTYNPFL